MQDPKVLKIMFRQSWFLAGSDIISKIILFLFQIILARRLGPKIFGEYSFVLTLSIMFIVFANCGFDVLSARNVAIERDESSKYLGNILLMKIPIALITLVTMVMTVWGIGYSKDVVFFTFWAGIMTIALSYSRLIYGFFRAFGVIVYEAYISATDRIASSLFCITLALSGYGLMEMFFSTAFISIITFFIAVLMLKYRLHVSPVFTIDTSMMRKTFKEATPLIVLAIFSVLYSQIGIVMLSLMKSSVEVGLYSSAARLLFLFQFIPGALVGVLLPLMSKQFSTKDKKIIESLSTGIRYMLFFGVISASAIFLFSREIVSTLYSDDFLTAIPALRIIIWTLPFFLINPILGNFLIAVNSQRLPALSVALTALISIVGNLILIPKYSLTGAAVAALVSEICLFAFQWYFSIKLLFFSHSGDKNKQTIFLRQILLGRGAL